MLLCSPVRPGLHKMQHGAHHPTVLCPLYHPRPPFWHALSSCYVLVRVQSFRKCELTEFSQEPFEMSPFYKRGNWGTELLDCLPRVTHHQCWVPQVTWHPLGRQSRSPQRWSAGTLSGGAVCHCPREVDIVHSPVVTVSTVSSLHPFTLPIFVESPAWAV